MDGLISKSLEDLTLPLRERTMKIVVQAELIDFKKRNTKHHMNPCTKSIFSANLHMFNKPIME